MKGWRDQKKTGRSALDGTEYVSRKEEGFIEVAKSPTSIMSLIQEEEGESGTVWNEGCYAQTTPRSGPSPALQRDGGE